MEVLLFPSKLGGGRTWPPPYPRFEPFGHYQRWEAVAAGGRTAGAVNSVGKSPVRLLRNDMISLISVLPSFIPSCTRPITFTASGRSRFWRYSGVSSQRHRLIATSCG